MEITSICTAADNPSSSSTFWMIVHFGSVEVLSPGARPRATISSHDQVLLLGACVTRNDLRVSLPRLTNPSGRLNDCPPNSVRMLVTLPTYQGAASPTSQGVSPTGS